MAGHGDLPAGGSCLRLLSDGVCPPEATMAGDVAMLEAFQRGEIPPTLRVYQWASPALTYGVNQQLPPRLVDACNALGIPMLRRPTGGKAVLHGHDLTVGLVFRAANQLSEPPSGSPCKQGEPFGGSPREVIEPVPPHGSPREAGGTLRRVADFPQSRPYPRQVYQMLAPALIEAFAQVGIPAVQGCVPAPDPRSPDDGGDCFATPAIADIAHADTGVKLMGCALLVRGACVLMQASIPLQIPEVPVERLFGHPHPAPPPIDPDALTDALYRTLTCVIQNPANAINAAP
jgi:lipoate-protein ligase A